MANQSVFRRYELKYLLTQSQKKIILAAMAPYMRSDAYGKTTIRNIYFDTDNYRLIRRSIEKPIYKEKLRIRSYKQATPSSTVFVELKRKYDHVVYKRRVALPEQTALDWVCDRIPCASPDQISAEIDYFLQYYGALRPTVFLSYERDAYYHHSDSSFRVTFDENIRCRKNDLSLECGVYGDPLLDNDHTLMEIKCAGGIPLWMTRVLSDQRIYKTSFSKYGTAYQTMIFPSLKSITNTEKELFTHA